MAPKTDENFYTVEEGDTWDSLAARFYGNRTLGRTLAGQNGANEDSEPAPGAEILVPGAEEAAGAASQHRGNDADTPRTPDTLGAMGPSGAGPSTAGIAGRTDVETLGDQDKQNAGGGDKEPAT